MKSIKTIPLMALLLLFAGVARGQECVVTAIPVKFGNFSTQSPAPLDTIGEITVSCRGALSYSVIIGPGSNSGGTFFPRKMAQNGHTLNYNLYIDPARHQVWGDGTGTTFVQSVSTAVFTPDPLQSGASAGKKGSANRKLNLAAGVRKDTFNVYGRIPAGQAIPAGQYTDNLTVTVNF